MRLCKMNSYFLNMFRFRVFSQEAKRTSSWFVSYATENVQLQLSYVEKRVKSKRIHDLTIELIMSMFVVDTFFGCTALQLLPYIYLMCCWLPFIEVLRRKKSQKQTHT